MDLSQNINLYYTNVTILSVLIQVISFLEAKKRIFEIAYRKEDGIVAKNIQWLNSPKNTALK